MPVPQTGHLPRAAWRPLRMGTTSASRMTFLALQRTQYPSVSTVMSSSKSLRSFIGRWGGGTLAAGRGAGAPPERAPLARRAPRAYNRPGRGGTEAAGMAEDVGARLEAVGERIQTIWSSL